MEEANPSFSSNEAGNPHSSETQPAGMAEQPTVILSPIEACGLAHTVDQSVSWMPVQATLPALPAEPQVYAGHPPATAYMSNYAQPGYPQTMYSQPSGLMPSQPCLTGPAASRKRLTKLWIGLIALLVFLLGSGTALAVVVSEQFTNTPEQALQQYCDGYKTSNGQKIYDILSRTSKANTSPAQIQQGFSVLKMFGNSTRIADCTVSNVQQHDSSSTGDLNMTVDVSNKGFAFSVSVLFSMGLVLEDNTWKIDTERMQFSTPAPDLTPDFLTPTVSNQ